MLLKGEKACMESAERFTFKRDGKTKNVVTKYIHRKIKSTAHEKRNIDPNNTFNTLPFGYNINLKHIFFIFDI